MTTTGPGPATGHEQPHLTPTEELLLDLMVANHRLGWTMQQIPRTYRRQLRRLAGLGLIGHDNGNVDNCDKAWLTEAGMVVGMDPHLVPPALGPNCRSFYMGESTNDSRVDCEKRNNHKGKHRAQWWTRAGHTGHAEPRDEGKAYVRWTDSEAGGYDSPRYGDQLRRIDHERSARFAAARTRFGVTTPDPDTDPQF